MKPLPDREKEQTNKKKLLSKYQSSQVSHQFPLMDEDDELIYFLTIFFVLILFLSDTLIVYLNRDYLLLFFMDNELL